MWNKVIAFFVSLSCGIALAGDSVSPAFTFDARYEKSGVTPEAWVAYQAEGVSGRFSARTVVQAVDANENGIPDVWEQLYGLAGEDALATADPVEIGGETKNIDLLLYVVPFHRYLVMEVKTTKYEPADLEQLSGYMVMAEHCLNTPQDNPPIGVLICKEHNRVLAKFHLEKLGLPMGISDYEIKKLLPTSAQLAKCYSDAEAQMAKKIFQ